ncbi:phage virion morphogenesis protein [Flavobacterium sp. '19STA2R22 D10 B1']|uniref:phage virion morphogenesis protein n=1 Tax=Flavobacterium aerium TaxID=3037261 RepID=UPI00278C27EB|nr:phage virion morphogenesis protein [Flavobacterium sp. '19STA2R22 D10 B1']
MTPEEFETMLKHKAAVIQDYASNTFPTNAGNITLRFINGNFRAGGFQGTNFQRWKKSNKKNGTTMVKSGALRIATYYTTQNGQVTMKNNLPYAKIHNEGGVINKPSRKASLNFKISSNGNSRFSKAKKANFQQDVKIMAHKITIPKRQFMPTSASDSPQLINSIQRDVARDIEKLFKR